MSDDFNIDDFIGSMEPSVPVHSEKASKKPARTRRLNDADKFPLPENDLYEEPEVLPKMALANWDADVALESIVEARAQSPGKTNLDIASKIIEQNTPLAVQSIVNLALYSKSESVRLRASQYIIDKNIASAAAKQESPEKSQLSQFFEAVESLANEGKS